MAYYCLHKFHWKPTDLLSMSREEKAFIMASIQIKSDNERKEQAKMKTRHPRSIHK